MTGFEHCLNCFKLFETVVEKANLEQTTLRFTCPWCNHNVTVDNRTRLVWKWDDFGKTYYLTLVSKYHPEDESIKPFGYYDVQ